MITPSYWLSAMKQSRTASIGLESPTSPVASQPTLRNRSRAVSRRRSAILWAAPSMWKAWSRGGVAGTTTWKRHCPPLESSRTRSMSWSAARVWLATMRYRATTHLLTRWSRVSRVHQARRRSTRAGRRHRGRNRSELHEVMVDEAAVVDAEPAEAQVRRGGPPLGRRAGVEQPLAVEAGGVEGHVAVAEDDEIGGGEAAPQPGLPALAGPGVVDHGDPE